MTSAAFPNQTALRRAAPVHHVWTPVRSAAGHHNPWTIAWILSIATFMEVLDSSVANVSLQHIAGSLSAGIDESTWVLTSYLVANAVILPVSGWLATVIGRKRFYMLCVTLFTISSLLCGLATSLPQLIFFRVLQGLGGGGLVPSEQAMLADTFPPEQRGKAFALYGLAVVVAPTLGPTLGGWITDTFTWHWIFLINVPVGIASLMLCGRFIHEPPAVQEDRRKIFANGLKVDYVGFGLIALGLASLEIMLDEGERNDWFASRFITTFAIIAAAALIGAIIWEWFQDEPVVDVRLIARRNFGMCLMVMFATGFALYSTTTLLPILVQTSHGYTALLAGWVLTPGGLAILIGMPIVGALTTKVQLRYLLAVGIVVQAAALYYMSGFPADLTFSHAMWARVFQSCTLGCLFIPITTLSYLGLPPGKNNVASSMVSVARNIGGSVGIALTSTWLAQRTQYHHSVLAERINPYNPAADMTLRNLQNHFETFGASAPQAGAQALSAVQGVVNRQAGILAFNDVCWLLAIIMACMLVLIPFMSRVKAEAGAAAAH